MVLSTVHYLSSTWQHGQRDVSSDEEEGEEGEEGEEQRVVERGQENVREGVDESAKTLCGAEGERRGK